VDFRERTLAILFWAARESEPYKSVLLLLVDCEAVDHGQAYQHQYTGASYKQLAKIARLAGFSFEQRREWYLLAESLGVSSRHAMHVIGRLTRQGERAA